MSSQEVDPKRRRFLTAATAAVGGVGAAFVAVPFIASFQPSARTKALGAPNEIDISKIEPGQRITDQWRGKPVWVVRRTPEMLEALDGMTDKLRDPQSEVEQQPGYAANPHRSIEPEYLVVVGLCTHLGCSPSFLPAEGAESMGPDWKGGFFCPCHGSKFDLAGRVYKGVPAPTNLEVPPYHYRTESVIVVGADQEAA